MKKEKYIEGINGDIISLDGILFIGSIVSYNNQYRFIIKYRDQTEPIVITSNSLKKEEKEKKEEIIKKFREFLLVNLTDSIIKIDAIKL